MKAAVCRAYGAPLSIESLSIAPPRRGEILIKTAACAICHSDIAFADGIWGSALPSVAGHEASGIITALGEHVTGFEIGDRVLVTLIRSCGSCPACERDQPTSCDHAYDAPPTPLSDANGAPIAQGMSTAAFAEQMIVDQSQCVKLPDDIDLDVASLLACGVITGFGAVTNTAKLQNGQTAAVIGAGGVGLNTIQGCTTAGASKIIAIDLNQEKLDTAKSFGATDGLLANTEDLATAVRDLTNGRGVDFAFVTVGAPEVFQSAPDLLAMSGAMVMVGLTGSDDEVTYKPVNIAAMNQSLLGSRMGQTLLHRDIPILLDLYRNGSLKLDELITGRYPLDRINEAIEDTRGGKSRRNVIVFDA